MPLCSALDVAEEVFPSYPDLWIRAGPWLWGTIHLCSFSTALSPMTRTRSRNASR
jgi:hypothetical protein